MGAGAGAVPFARSALDHGGDPDGHRVARHRLLEVELQRITNVRSTVRPGASGPRPEDVAEDVVEDVPEPAGEAGRAERVGVYPVVAELIVSRPPLRIGQNLVGFLGLLEALLGPRVVRVPVRVVLHRKAAIRLLHRIVAGAALDLQHVVVIALRHPRPPASLPAVAASGHFRSSPTSSNSASTTSSAAAAASAPPSAAAAD